MTNLNEIGFLKQKIERLERELRKVRQSEEFARQEETNLTPLRDKSGEVNLISETGIDVAANRQAKQDLERQRDRLIQAQKIVNLGYWDLYLDTGVLEWSEEVYTIFDRDPKSYTPTVKGFEASIHPDDFQSYMAERQAALLENRDVIIEHRIITPSGKIRYVREVAKIYKDASGKVTRVMGTVQDITPLSDTNEKLKRIIRDQDAILDNVPAYIIFKDTKNTILKVTESVARATGRARDEIEGKSSVEIYPDMAEKKWQDDLEVINSGQPKRGILETLTTSTGEERWLMTDKVPYFENDEVAGIIILATDVTDRIKVENTLRESEAKFRSIFDSSGVGMAVLDLKGNIVMANRAVTKILGYSQEEIVAKNFRDITYQEDLEESNANFAKLLSGEDIFYNIPKRYTHKDGHIVWGILTVSLVKDDFGKLRFCIGQLQDVTEGIHAQVALQESELKYKAMMESMDEAVYICSEDYRIEYLNPAMMKRIGRDATGEKCYKAIHGRKSRCEWCAHDRVMKGARVQTEIQKPEKQEFFLVSHSPVRHDDGTVSKLTIYRDVSAVKKLETHLQQSQKMEAIGTLAGGIAHDFNNMLSPIIGYTEILQDEIAPESQQHEYLDEIFQASVRASDLVKQILAFSRQHGTDLTPVKLQSIVEESHKFIRASIPTTIDISYGVDNACGPVMADRTQVHQILMNLTTNAYHAIGEASGRIRVTLQQVDGDSSEADVAHLIKSSSYARIQVTDNGCGMEQSVIDKIFDPYFTTKETGKGTGLGLSIVRGIVTSYKGDIQIKSSVGEGSEVSVYLPIIEAHLSRNGALDYTAAVTGSETILLVDDEEYLVKMTTKMLESLGYRVMARTGSVEAFEAFKARPDDIDLIVSDMTMPNLTGVELTEKIRALGYNTPVVICTGYSSRINESNAASLGIQGFVMKPVLKKELAQVVRDVLHR